MVRKITIYNTNDKDKVTKKTEKNESHKKLMDNIFSGNELSLSLNFDSKMCNDSKILKLTRSGDAVVYIVSFLLCI